MELFAAVASRGYSGRDRGSPVRAFDTGEARMKEAGKWALATVAVLTLPLWALPALIGMSLYKAIKTFKEEVIDNG